jgi:hypothetical protein
VTRQQFGLALGNLGKLAFERFRDSGVKRASPLPQQCPIGCVLHQGMLEEVCRVWWHALPEQQTGGNKSVERRRQLHSRLAHHRSQQCMRKLPPDRSANLRHLLGGAEPVETRHQRCVQACGNRQAGRWNCRDGATRVAFALGFQHRLRHLLDEERNAISALDDVLSNARRKLVPN